MPTASEILRGLSDIASELIPLAIAWHLALVVALVALALGWRPTRRRAGVLLALPLVSASAVAFGYGVVVNGVALALTALLLVVGGARLAREPVDGGPPWTRALGALAVGYGWVYPHFLDEQHPALYVVAAPLGVLPCPTLSVVLGLALLADGLRSRSWSTFAALAGFSYAFFGLSYLGVWLDAGLLLGSCALGWRAWQSSIGARPLDRARPPPSEEAVQYVGARTFTS